MLCPTCSKLAVVYLNKKCIRCQGGVLQNISVICDTCSSREKQCSACLKKVDNNPNKKHYYGGCGSCRR